MTQFERKMYNELYLDSHFINYISGLPSLHVNYVERAIST